MGISNGSLFADDTMAECTGNSITEVNNKLQDDIDTVMLCLKKIYYKSTLTSLV